MLFITSFSNITTVIIGMVLSIILLKNNAVKVGIDSIVVSFFFGCALAVSRYYLHLLWNRSLILKVRSIRPKLIHDETILLAGMARVISDSKINGRLFLTNRRLIFYNVKDEDKNSYLNFDLENINKVSSIINYKILSNCLRIETFDAIVDFDVEFSSGWKEILCSLIMNKEIA